MARDSLNHFLLFINLMFLRRQVEEERLRQQKLREVEDRERALKEQEERWRRERQEEDDRCAHVCSLRMSYSYLVTVFT